MRDEGAIKMRAQLKATHRFKVHIFLTLILNFLMFVYIFLYFHTKLGSYFNTFIKKVNVNSFPSPFITQKFQKASKNVYFHLIDQTTDKLTL